jgi:hypothetical protein
MIIKLEKFGTTLISRPAGKEAYLSLQQTLKDIKETEIVEVDFDGVLTFSPGWGDEVLTPLLNAYGERITLKDTTNLSVLATIKMLEEINGKKFKK